MLKIVGYKGFGWLESWGTKAEIDKSYSYKGTCDGFTR